jgi:rhodanese-related sulfurtransferase
MTALRRIVTLALLLPALPAGAFSLSQAPVTPDPSVSQPAFVALWPHINLAEAKRLLGQPGVVFVDGRSYGEWERSHLPGALPLPSGEFDKRYPLLKKALVHARVVVCYCHGFTCGIADYVAQLLTDRGHRNVAVYSGGYPEWKHAKLPMEGQDAPGIKQKKTP